VSATHKTDVILIGGGAGSYLLAIHLAKAGLRSLIVERQPSPTGTDRPFTPPPRGEIIQPSALSLLDEIGILSELCAADVHRFTKVHFHEACGPLLCTVHYDTLPEPYRYALNIVPDLLLQRLLARASTLSLITRVWQGAFHALIREGGRIVGCEVKVGEKIQRFLAPVVVGADGADSAVRRAFGVPYRLHHYPEGYFTFWVDCPPGFDSSLRYYAGNGTTLALFPVSKETLYLFYRIPAAQRAAIQLAGIERFKKDLIERHEAIRPMLARLFEKIVSWDQVGFRPAVRVRCRQWATDGGVLIGDAAHAMNPHVANGRNASLKDGKILAGVLQDCFRRGDFSENMLRRYEAERRFEVDPMQRLGDELRFVWDTAFAPVVWARNRSFRTIHHDRRLHDKMVRTISGVAMEPFTLTDRWRALCS